MRNQEKINVEIYVLGAGTGSLHTQQSKIKTIKRK